MIRLRIINPDFETENEKVDYPTWYTRAKSYDWDTVFSMDDDIKNCTVGHNIDSIELDNFYLNNKNSIDDLIEFLQIAKESLQVE